MNRQSVRMIPIGPTGRDKIAQGKALGFLGAMTGALKARDNRGIDRVVPGLHFHPSCHFVLFVVKPVWLVAFTILFTTKDAKSTKGSGSFLWPNGPG